MRISLPPTVYLTRCFFSPAVFFNLREARALGSLILQPSQHLPRIYLSNAKLASNLNDGGSLIQQHFGFVRHADDLFRWKSSPVHFLLLSSS
jgi:hypothetical protein